MPLVCKPDFPLDDYKRIIERYEFPISDLSTAVQFLKELPNYCNVDLPESIKFDNKGLVRKEESEFNLKLLCANDGFASSRCAIHIVFKEIRIVEIETYKFVVICSESALSDCPQNGENYKYVANGNIVVIHPTIHDVYNRIYRQIKP